MFLTTILLQGVTALIPAISAPEIGPDEELRAAINALQEPADPTSVWTRSADVGVIEESGNTNALNSSANLTLKWEMPGVQSWDLTGQYRAKREQDETTGQHYSDRRLIVLGTSYRHVFSQESSFYGYGKAARREDKPNDLIRRFDVGAGVGYQWDLYTDAYARVEVGASYVEDIKTGLMPIDTVAGRFAYDVNTPLSENVSFVNMGESLEGDELRTYNHMTSFKWTLSRIEVAEVFLSINYEVIYDGNPVPGDAAIDRIISITLGSVF